MVVVQKIELDIILRVRHQGRIHPDVPLTQQFCIKFIEYWHHYLREVCIPWCKQEIELKNHIKDFSKILLQYFKNGPSWKARLEFFDLAPRYSSKNSLCMKEALLLSNLLKFVKIRQQNFLKTHVLGEEIRQENLKKFLGGLVVK